MSGGGDHGGNSAGTEPKVWQIGGIAVVFVAGVWGLNWYVSGKMLGVPHKAGEFGDMFGAANALFSGLAFAFVIIAIILQQYEIKNQVKELRRAAEAQTRSEEALNRQAIVLGKTLTLSALMELQRMYHSPEVSDARERMLNFQHNHARAGSDVFQAYQANRLNTERPRGHTISLERHKEIIAHFYQSLAAVWEGGLLPSDIVYAIWPESQLRLIQDIILPIEEGLERERRKSESTFRNSAIVQLRHLYQSSRAASGAINS